MRQTASGLRWSLPCPEASWVCPDSSWSAELEAGSDFKDGSARCSVRVFERYSMVGGSQAVFFKMNTLGEDAFLEDVKQLLEEILEG